MWMRVMVSGTASKNDLRFKIIYRKNAPEDQNTIYQKGKNKTCTYISLLWNFIRADTKFRVCLFVSLQEQ